MDDQPVFTPMRASLNRPQLLMGGDRELVLLSGLLLALMAVSVMSFLSFLIAGVSFMAIVACWPGWAKKILSCEGLCAAFGLQGFLPRRRAGLRL